MFKRDWVTIAIIALCVAVIAFLVYRLTKGKQEEAVTSAQQQEEPAVDTSFYEGDITTYEIDTLTSTPATTTPATSQPPVETRESTISPEGGRYLVLAGTYRQMANAERALRNMKSKGYTNARIELFDKGTYAVILVDRFDDIQKARELQRRLKGDGIEAYIKLKQ